MLKQFMEKIFTQYQSAKREKYVDNKLVKLIKKDFPNNLKEELTKNIGDYKIIGYSGEGKWTTSPYIAILDPQITNSIESGFYVLYIFSEDSKKVYLSLNQGLKNEKGLDPSVFLEELENNSIKIRNQSKIPDGFITNKLTGLGSHYYFKRLESGNICSKSYYYDNLPSEEELFSDLNNLLMYYQDFNYDSSGSLSDDQIIELLQWFVNSSETYRNWMPKRREAENINHSWIQPEIIKNMSDEDLKEHYIEYYNSGTGEKQNINAIYRDRIIRDNNFRDSLYYLLNEDIDIKNRINDLLDRKNEKHIEGMGKALITALLMDFKPEKYCLWNGKTEDGLKALGWDEYHSRGDSGGDVYIKVLNLLRKLTNLVPEFELEFLDIDLFLHVIVAEEEGIDQLNRIKNMNITIKESMEFIFENLPKARSKNEPVKGHRIGKAFLEISKSLDYIVKLINSENEYKSQAYYQDRGNWYRKPYIYVENKDNKDIYGQWDQHFVGFWFNEDLESVRISLQQGDTYAQNLLSEKLGEYSDEDLEEYIQSHAEDVRHQINKSGLIGNLDDFDEDFGNRTIFGKEYNKNNLPSNQEIISDFHELFKMYLLLKPDLNGGITVETTFFNDLKEQGYFFDYKLVENFLLSLKVKPFVILTGNSGTGKTKIAQLFAKYLEKNNKIKTIVNETTADEYNTKKEANEVISTIKDSIDTYPNDQVRDLLPNLIEGIDVNKDSTELGKYEIIPVGANWTENRHILGFYNVITSEYNFTKSLKIILNAENNKNSPYFLILDEMNLSHVERYFSDFLSAIESNEDLELHSNEDLKVPPSKIKLTSNLMVIGTVNIDETTYMFSPKVLDRANTLEFLTQPASDYMSKTPEYNIKGDIEYLLNPLSDLDLRKNDINELKDMLNVVRTDNNKLIWGELTFYINEFQETLKKADFDFGFRTINEIIRFMIVAWKYEGQKEVWDNWERYFDAQILQKMLPKIHGSQRELDSVLKELRLLCNETNTDNILFSTSAEKLDKMSKRLSEKRYVAFTG